MQRAQLERSLEQQYYGAYVKVVTGDGSLYHGRVSSVAVWNDEVIMMIDNRRFVMSPDEVTDQVQILSPRVNNGNTTQ